MSLSMMQEAVRITDRFYGFRDADTIERQGRLQNAIMLVFIMHMVMMVALIKLQEFDIAHPRIIREVDVAFELTPPPPEPPPKQVGLPNAISLTAGANPNPGSEAAPNPANAPLSLPALKAPAINPVPTLAAKPMPSRKTTIAAPVAVTPTNVVKANVGQAIPKQAPVPPPAPLIAALPPNQPLSGAPVQGGVPGAHDAGIGGGGQGQGGTGVGQGDVGQGTGEGPAGVPIATRLSSTRAMGNISPYRKDLLLRLAQNWHPKKSYEDLIVLLTINHEGQLISSEIFQSSGSKKADKEALAALEATQYAPLPDWYKGEQLTFKIQLSKVEALKQ